MKLISVSVVKHWCNAIIDLCNDVIRNGTNCDAVFFFRTRLWFRSLVSTDYMVFGGGISSEMVF